MAEGLHERDDGSLVEHRHRDAEVRQVADAALGEVDVVVKVDVARLHRLQWIVAHDRVDQGRVRPTGELAQPAVVDAAEVVASRIIGERAVRPIAVSTSFSMEARLPLTISSNTGSTLAPPTAPIMTVGS
jgi:hypothetical protein